MSTDMSTIKQVPLPCESRLINAYEHNDLEDAFEVSLPDNAVDDPEVLARFLMVNQAPWVTDLMAIRDVIVSPFGLKTAKQLLTDNRHRSDQQLHYFQIIESYPDEIVFGVDDRHLDFRLSMLYRRTDPRGTSKTAVLCTVVHCHNRLGKIYLAIIAPFHRAVVRSGLDRATRSGWPTSPCS